MEPKIDDIQPSEVRVHDALRTEAMRLIVDSTYSARGHQAAGRRWAWWHTILGVPTTVLTTLLASGAAFSAAISNDRWLTVTLSSLTAALAAIRGFLRPGETADEHGAKGNRYLSIRNDARFFLNIDLIADFPVSELSARLRDLRSRYNDLNESTPLHIHAKDYASAKASIERGESNYEDDPIWKELEADGKNG